jgi:hypothetical protein
MADKPIVLTVPDDISLRARQIAESTSQGVEEVLLNNLRSLPRPLPDLPHDIQDELDALHHLSNDTLWTIAQEQIPETIQQRALELMTNNTRGKLSEAEQEELEALVQRADRLMLRKAEAASILTDRGHKFSQADYKPQDD